MFDLVRPCKNCPFRSGCGSRFQLSRERLRGIIEGPAFQCHGTVDYSDDEGPQPGDRPQQCAGLMAVLNRDGQLNQIMQVASRLGHLDLDALDPDRVAYASIKEATRAHLEGVEPMEGKIA